MSEVSGMDDYRALVERAAHAIADTESAADATAYNTGAWYHTAAEEVVEIVASRHAGAVEECEKWRKLAEDYERLHAPLRQQVEALEAELSELRGGR